MPEDSALQRSFQTTRWSLVARAQDADPAQRREALDELLRIYRPALRAHLVLRKRLDVNDADDLLQGFTADKILERNLFAHADPSKGKLRSLLLRALEHYFIDEKRRERAGKRSMAPDVSLEQLDQDVAQPDRHPDSDVFEVKWAQQVLAQAMELMRTECHAAEKLDVWGVFHCRILQPLLNGTPVPQYDALVEQFGLASPEQASNRLVTGKRHFERALRAVVSDYAPSERAVDEEIAHLREAVASVAL